MIKALKKKLKQILFKHDISFITIQLFNGNVSVITIGLYLSEFYKLKYEVNMQVLHYNNLIRAKPKNSPLDDEDYWDIILPLAQEIINLNKKLLN
jgi:hypothetical protein